MTVYIDYRVTGEIYIEIDGEEFELFYSADISEDLPDSIEFEAVPNEFEGNISELDYLALQDAWKQIDTTYDIIEKEGE